MVICFSINRKLIQGPKQNSIVIKGIKKKITTNNVKFMKSAIQENITRNVKKQKCMTRNQEKNQSIETYPLNETDDGFRKGL